MSYTNNQQLYKTLLGSWLYFIQYSDKKKTFFYESTQSSANLFTAIIHFQKLF